MLSGMQILILLIALVASYYILGPGGVLLCLLAWAVIFFWNTKKALKPAPAIKPAPVAKPTPPQPAPPPPFSVPRAAPPPVAVPPPVPVQPLSFVTFTDPVAAAFTVEVVRGWQVRGGLQHPGLGDRRACVEAQSPDGIFVIQGDPNCPQCFCHYPMQMEDVMVPSTVGCTFLNIPPSGKRLAAYYLKNIAPQRFGSFTVTARRDRDDMAAADLKAARQSGIPLPRNWKTSQHEVRFETGGRMGCLYACTGYDTSMSLGFMTQFEGTVQMWFAPPALAVTAENALARIKTSFPFTPNAYQIAQQDEMLIASNGMAANMNQQVWFQGQQAVHHAQVAQGNVIVDNYWQQQKLNDGIAQSYWNAQDVNDRLSQDRSDAMLDRQRLYDDSLGKYYDAPAGSNYYWRDQQGQIVGTETGQPPVYLNNYTLLRKD